MLISNGTVKAGNTNSTAQMLVEVEADDTQLENIVTELESRWSHDTLLQWEYTSDEPDCDCKFKVNNNWLSIHE